MDSRFLCLPFRTSLAAGARGPRPHSVGTPSRCFPTSGSLLSFLLRALCSIGAAFLLPEPSAAQAPFLVKDNNTADPTHLVNVNGMLLFTAGSGLWKSDGTEAGTVLAKALGAFSNPRSLTNVNGTLFFAADDGTHGDELWKSDGSEAGTVLVRDIFPSAGHGSPSSLANVNGTLFFQVNDGTTGQGLWKSDGTEAGTVLVKAIGPVTPESLTNVNGTLFFAVDDGTSGNELWMSDGTEAGTVLVKDIQPGSGGSGPAALTNANGTLVFSADDGSAGREPWRSDGTAAGTMRIADINVGAGGSSPAEFTVSGPHTFFVANDGPASAELWAMSSPPPLAVSDRRPDAITLLGNRPNPFSRATQIGFDLPRPARIALRLYDVSGRLGRRLTDGSWPAGRHSIEWNGTREDGREAPAGVYLLRMESEGFRSYRRAVVLR